MFKAFTQKTNEARVFTQLTCARVPTYCALVYVLIFLPKKISIAIRGNLQIQNKILILKKSLSDLSIIGIFCIHMYVCMCRKD